MQLSKREKILLIVVLVVAIFTVVFIWVYQPNMERVNNINAIIESEQPLLDGLPVKEEQIREMSDQKVQLEGEIEAALAPLLDAGDEPALIRHLHQIFLNAGGIRSIAITDETIREEFSQVEVSISYDTIYEDFYWALVGLENSPFPNSLMRLAISDIHILEDENLVDAEGEAVTPTVVPLDQVVAIPLRNVSIEKILSFYFRKPTAE